MIRVTHNGVESALGCDAGGSLGEAIRACARGAQGATRVVTRVRVNGCDVPEDALARLEDFSLEGVSEIELESRPAREVAFASLETSAEYAASLHEALARTAEHLRTGRIEDANRLYAYALDGITVLVFAVEAAARELGESAAPLGGLEQALLPWLEALVPAQEERDWVRVADYLEHEIAPLLDGWRAKLVAVRRLCAGGEESDGSL